MVKKDVKKDEKIEEEIQEEAMVETDEKEILKQAEEREKERKSFEESAKEDKKELLKKEKAEVREEKILRKTQQRVKPRHGKKYRALEEKIDKNKEYSVDEAVALALETNPAKFDATIELHVKLSVKEKNNRGMVVLPGGVTKEKKVLEVVESNIDEVIANVKAGKADFDVMIADMKVMPKLAQLAKILGPKGLMPSPKAGTVVPDVKKAAAELRGGKVEFRADKFNNIHMAIGKISFGAEKVKLNYQAILDHLPKRVDAIYLTTSMGPSIKVTKK